METHDGVGCVLDNLWDGVVARPHSGLQRVGIGDLAKRCREYLFCFGRWDGHAKRSSSRDINVDIVTKSGEPVANGGDVLGCGCCQSIEGIRGEVVGVIGGRGVTDIESNGLNAITISFLGMHSERGSCGDSSVQISSSPAAAELGCALHVLWVEEGRQKGECFY